MPHILDLPTELLIKIIAVLDVRDIGSCLLTCRRLKDIIQDTCLLQYLIQTTLAGVHDPLLHSGPPLARRLESLKRWSDAWHQPGAYLRSPSRVLTPTSTSKSFILCDDYLIALDFGGRQRRRQGYRHVAGYEWLDLRNPTPSDDDGWTKIQFEENLFPLAVALALDADQEDLLAILFGCPEHATFQLRLLEFYDGSPHSLASRPCIDIALPTEETHYIGLKTHMSMMGPYIIVAAGLPPERTGIDVLFLVDWQKGHVTTLCSTQTRTYLTDFLVLSDNVLALIRSPKNAIELCRIDTTTNSTAASLQTICLLELPPLVLYARLSSASLNTENYSSKSPSRRSVSRCRPPPRHCFSPSPTEALVLLTLTAKITGSAFIDMRTYTLAVHARTLLSYASASSHTSRSESSLPPAVSWDTWGPLATRCFEAPTDSSSSSVVVAGQRWLDIKSGTIRDFCPHRAVRRRAPVTTTATETDTGNPLIGLRNSTLPAGRMFACDIESALPYCESSLEKDDEPDSSFGVEDAMIDMDRVVFLTGPDRDQITIHVYTMG